MNHLFIIGNGFDLAHGLKTRYSDFVEDNLRTTILNVLRDPNYCKVNHSLFQVKLPNPLKSAFTDELLENPFQIFDAEYLKEREIIEKTGASSALKLLQRKAQDLKWVDFEKLYFEEVVNLINSETKIQDKMKEIEFINKELDIIKCHLINYLKSIEDNWDKQPDLKIETHFNRITNQESIQNIKEVSIVLLNFNYTTTHQIYFRLTSFRKGLNQVLDQINIHGLAMDLNMTDKLVASPADLRRITLGYGDEFSSEYQTLLSFGEPKLARHFKSFNYSLSDQYSKLIAFIEGGAFEVHVMGHSLGKSDKVLLREIFESENCKKIFSYYKDRDDYISKVFNAASIFEKPDIMRRKIANFTECKPLTF